MPRMRTCKPIRMEDVERVELLAGRRKQYRSAGDGANGKRRASARIAIELGQDDAGNLQPLMESLGDIGSLLTGHRIGNEDDMMGPDGSLQALQFLHQIVVDLQAACGIDAGRHRCRQSRLAPARA